MKETERRRETSILFIACSFWSIQRKLFSFGFTSSNNILFVLAVSLCCNVWNTHDSIKLLPVPLPLLLAVKCLVFLLVSGSSDLQMLVALDQIRTSNKWKNVWWCYAYGAIEAITMRWSKFEPKHLVPFSFLFLGLGAFFCSQLLLTNSKKNGTNFINETPEMERNTIAELIVCIVCVCVWVSVQWVQERKWPSLFFLYLSQKRIFSRTHWFPFSFSTLSHGTYTSRTNEYKINKYECFIYASETTTATASQKERKKNDRTMWCDAMWCLYK